MNILTDLKHSQNWKKIHNILWSKETYNFYWEYVNKWTFFNFYTPLHITLIAHKGPSSLVTSTCICLRANDIPETHCFMTNIRWTAPQNVYNYSSRMDGKYKTSKNWFTNHQMSDFITKQKLDDQKMRTLEKKFYLYSKNTVINWICFCL